ncbi:MAG: hypothetical protein DMF64_13845 [Acidobacteria bacterium]|nr:MAG: hypothetical protein DMF64_13845 [Acidobacteriota bacterium]
MRDAKGLGLFMCYSKRAEMDARVASMRLSCWLAARRDMALIVFGGDTHASRVRAELGDDGAAATGRAPLLSALSD